MAVFIERSGQTLPTFGAASKINADASGCFFRIYLFHRSCGCVLTECGVTLMVFLIILENQFKPNHTNLVIKAGTVLTRTLLFILSLAVWDSGFFLHLVILTLLILK